MADIDKQKEKVSTIRALWLLLIATLFSLFAYLFNNYLKLTENQLIIALVSIIIISISTLITTYFLFKSINKLKDL